VHTIKDIKEKISVATAAQLGKFGENLFEKYLNSKAIDYKRVHQRGIDFVVDGIGDLDLKTKKYLEIKNNGKVNRYRFKLDGVKYGYLQLFSDKIIIYLDSNGLVSHFGEIKWTECVQMMCDFEFRKNSQKPSSFATAKKKEICNWIKSQWGLDARIISRSGKKAQDSFEDNGWGPNNFYSGVSGRKKYDATVLIYFDEGDIYKIFAYATTLIDEINWFSKDKGPNPQGIMIFNPRNLNNKFIFSSLDDFKENYLDRMS
jgi:hypothetical protein